MSIKSILKINEGVGVDSKPKGWIVREIYDPKKNKSIVFEFGIYIDENTFLGVPLHYSFKDKLIPTTAMSKNDDYKYYFVKDETEFGLSTFKNKKGKLFPVLVEPSEKHPAMKIVCIALAPEEPDKIIHSELLRNDNIIIRDYIDKDRKSIAMVVACTDTNLVNPAIKLSITSGPIDSKVITVRTFNIALTPNIDTVTKTTNEVVKTKFIKFNRFIRKPKTKNDKVDDKNTDPTE